ncbi:MAG: hypothetical protein FJY17_04740 [Bacteroidetes bacterium]|nr:hypothetical protein [Bacteroidota bacterium]
MVTSLDGVSVVVVLFVVLPPQDVTIIAVIKTAQFSKFISLKISRLIVYDKNIGFLKNQVL